MRSAHRLMIAGVLTGALGSVALAQGGPGAFMKFRDQHKYTFQLITTTSRGMTECERTATTRIKPAQAKQILAVLAPLRKQPKLSQEQAKGAIQKLQRVLETPQLTAVDKAIKDAAARRGGPGGGAPGGGATGGGAPGGGAPGGGNRPPFDPAKMKDFNPFNPDKSSLRYEQNKERNEKLFAFLTARAAGKDAKLNLPPPGGNRR